MAKRPPSPGRFGRAILCSTLAATFGTGLALIGAGLGTSFADAKRREDEHFLAAMRAKSIAVETRLAELGTSKGASTVGLGSQTSIGVD